ncbi:myosin light chain kinase, smooth muscle-like isoform X1 [Arapaima gigas]
MSNSCPRRTYVSTLRIDLKHPSSAGQKALGNRSVERTCVSRKMEEIPDTECNLGIKSEKLSTQHLHNENKEALKHNGEVKESADGSVEQPRSPAHRAESPLKFEKTPEHLEVKAGEQTKLQCTFRSSFPVACCWIHNKQQVVSGPGIQVESNSCGSKLVISETWPEHSGNYTIVARDHSSSIQHKVSLSVVDRPKPPASAPVISQLSSSSLVLSWSGPSYDGGAAITGYAVEVKAEGPRTPGNWTEVTSCCTSTSYRVQTGLEPQGQYCFRVRAYNRVGVSKPSQESEIIKMDTPAEPLEEHQKYVNVTIDTANKVTDHYNVLEKLGVGKFGQVFHLKHKETGRECAGKFYKARLSKEKAAARKEIELMNELHHPKLVQCLGAYESRSELVMVMEFIAGGELFERIVDDNFEHTEPTCVQYMQQILEGMQYMHQKNIVHLDLKPENIVCTDRTGTFIKIIDFGLASQLDPKTPLKVMHGTPEFVAPEVIAYEPVGLATDMWSIGVICYILLSGESPFLGDNDAETLALVTAAQWEFDEESFEEITEQAKDFISSLLKKDMKRRLSCEKALAHPWMATFASTDPHAAKSLSKEKMKKFLARQKWKKTGKALLALKRMALLSNKSDGPEFPGSPEKDSVLSPEMEFALEKQLQQEPCFSQALVDQTHPLGSTVRLTCHIEGYPNPTVQWLLEGELVAESPRLQVKYDPDGGCSLVLNNIRLEDAGVYVCKATNSLGKAMCSAKLTVV